jgi:hypothetical protein
MADGPKNKNPLILDQGERLAVVSNILASLDPESFQTSGEGEKKNVIEEDRTVQVAQTLAETLLLVRDPRGPIGQVIDAFGDPNISIFYGTLLGVKKIEPREGVSKTSARAMVSMGSWKGTPGSDGATFEKEFARTDFLNTPYGRHLAQIAQQHKGWKCSFVVAHESIPGTQGHSARVLRAIVPQFRASDYDADNPTYAPMYERP